jgi:hypothetical protein
MSNGTKNKYCDTELDNVLDNVLDNAQNKKPKYELINYNKRKYEESYDDTQNKKPKYEHISEQVNPINKVTLINNLNYHLLLNNKIPAGHLVIINFNYTFLFAEMGLSYYSN